MIRTLTATAALLAFSLTACGQNAGDPVDINKVLAERGLTAAEAALKAGPQTDESSFLLGGVQAMRAIEHVLQVRYNSTEQDVPFVPGGMVPMPSNPDGKFDPLFLDKAMTGALEHLANAEASLQRATKGDFAVTVDASALWMDINSNGKRDAGEDILPLLGGLAGQRPGDDTAEALPTTIQFDTADADWLAAYVHLTSGMAELTLSIDPGDAISRVHAGNETMRALGGTEEFSIFGGGDQSNELTTLAMFIEAFNGPVDQKRTRAAHAHFKQTIVHNKAFWKEVMAETDDSAEWLPNPNQLSAFGVPVTQEMADTWQLVLADASDILEGKQLIPYWRFGNRRGGGEGVGVNVAKVFQNPGDFSLVMWIHGAGAAPFLERGRLADMEAMDAFDSVTGGQGALFSFWMN